jgi:signal transduction histidine kinase
MALPSRKMPGFLSGLSVKLIATIVVVILAVEIVLYFPFAAAFRQDWLADRLRVGSVAARVLDAVPDAMNLPRMLTNRLLGSAEAFAIVYRREGQSQLIERDGVELPREAVTVDMNETGLMARIAGVVDTLLAADGRVLRIVGSENSGEAATIEVLMPEAPLRAELWTYSRSFVLLWLALALVTSAVLYILLARILIAPIRRLTGSMVAFRAAPENAALIIAPSPRGDEIGVMEAELAAMEADLFSMLRQRRHLADLGLAVAKINHDLRNTLTSAQLLSDQVATLDDPKVQRLAPRLVLSIDKAIGFAQSVLDYGRQSVTPPRPVPLRLREVIDEAAFIAGLAGHPVIGWDNGLPADLVINADAEQTERIFVKLLKNAREALEAANGKIDAPAISASFAETPDWLTVSIADNGPGLPPRAREHLFVAFEGSARSGGTGLGLAIARELAEGQGGRLTFVEQPVGTRFDVAFPADSRRS